MKTSSPQPVPGWVSVAAWGITLLIWAGTALNLTLEGFVGYQAIGALVTAAAGTALFLPIARGSAGERTLPRLFMCAGVMTVASTLEASLSGPWWWYVAAVVLCAGMALSVPISEPWARAAALAAVLLLAAAALLPGAWLAGSTSGYDRTLAPATVLVTLLLVSLEVRALFARNRSAAASD